MHTGRRVALQTAHHTMLFFVLHVPQLHVGSGSLGFGLLQNRHCGYKQEGKEGMRNMSASCQRHGLLAPQRERP